MEGGLKHPSSLRCLEGRQVVAPVLSETTEFLLLTPCFLRSAFLDLAVDMVSACCGFSLLSVCFVVSSAEMDLRPWNRGSSRFVCWWILSSHVVFLFSLGGAQVSLQIDRFPLLCELVSPGLIHARSLSLLIRYGQDLLVSIGISLGFKSRLMSDNVTFERSKGSWFVYILIPFCRI